MSCITSILNFVSFWLSNLPLEVFSGGLWMQHITLPWLLALNFGFCLELILYLFCISGSCWPCIWRELYAHLKEIEVPHKRRGDHLLAEWWMLVFLVLLETHTCCWGKQGNTKRHTQQVNDKTVVWGLECNDRMQHSLRKRTVGDESIYSKSEYE